MENELGDREQTLALTAELPSGELIEKKVNDSDYFDDVHRATCLHLALRKGGTLWRQSQGLAITHYPPLQHTSV